MREHPLLQMISKSVADSGFRSQGAPTSKVGGANLLFGQIFPENCTKMKESGPRSGGRPQRRPLHSPMEISIELKN